MKKHLSKLNILIVILSIYCISLLLLRIKIANSFFYLFLVWNLFLAYIPFFLSSIILQNKRIKKSKIKFWSLFFIWILFLPNAPYILTDFVHLQQGKAMPYWFDLLLISSFSINGLILFFISINDIHKIIQQKYSTIKAWFLTTTIFFLCGFGIYLGRFLRWNSWDILQKPQLLITDIFTRIIHPTEHPKTWGVTLGFGLFFIINFMILKLITLKPKASNDI